MSYTNGLDKPDDYFNTVLYTGDGTSNRSITGVGFQPDWVWYKSRNTAVSHVVTDAVRGVGKELFTDGTDAENSGSFLGSFDSDGFTISASSQNTSSRTYVAWNWKASNATASSNTDGSITSSVSANTDSGFSIVSYTGNGTSGATIGHGLSAKPSWIVTKRRNSAEDWANYHSSLTADYYMYFTTNASTNDATKWNDTEPTSSVFSVGNHASVNGSSDTYIAYCFAEKKGYSKFGSYTGNGNADGTFVYTGFKPAWVMYKRTDTTGDWFIHDVKREPHNVIDEYLEANTSNAEATATGNITDFLSNGFKLRASGGTINTGTMIYMAFAENPFVTSTGIPTCAR